MSEIDQEIDRILRHLRHKIRKQGFTQRGVQETLGWGRSYISQLVTGQKSVRIDQVLAILEVIGIDPALFFRELYPPSPERGVLPPTRGGELVKELEPVRAVARNLVATLLEGRVLTAADLDALAQLGGDWPSTEDSSDPPGGS